MTGHLPPVGATVVWRRRSYMVVRHGCATRWDGCPHGDHAVTVERVDRPRGTECAAAGDLEVA